MIPRQRLCKTHSYEEKKMDKEEVFFFNGEWLLFVAQPEGSEIKSENVCSACSDPSFTQSHPSLSQRR